MKSRWRLLRTGRRAALCAGSLALISIVVPFAIGAEDENTDERETVTPETTNAESADKPVVSLQVPLSVARDRAKLMHQVYTATLDVMHDRYFHADRAVVPARAMEDVLSNIERDTGARANWISVNLKAMSINHDPSTEFEKHAAKEIAAGKDDVEVVEDGYYRRATPIPLHGGCVSCHAGFSQQQSKKPKFAGLVISIPVMSDVPNAQP